MDDTLTARSQATTDAATVSERVIEAVAAATDVSPLKLDPPLFTVVDPEALEAFVASIDAEANSPHGRVEFAYCGCDVTVTAAGVVTVSDPLDE